MKTLLSCGLILLLLVSCADKKKENEIKIEQSIQKIDSIEQAVEKDIKSLEEITNDVQDDLKELDNI
ncbi:hypothetical protein [Thalassobellus citreus]|uniref:hypothetical protein n=1 Tax=Thalassobellus citreus TaxID=3367752 RepID=UPI0037B35345